MRIMLWKLSGLTVLGLLAVSAVAGQSAPAKRLAADATWLAADAREGRLTGTRGATEAADWLARRFREAGLSPGVDGKWFQEYPIAKDAPALKGTGLDTLPSLHARNVIGVLRGTDPLLRNEAVVVGAHYDHLGRGVLGARDGAGEIHNGADDNASGTATLVEIARQLVRQRPRRTIVFVAFSGEEEGLLGSAAYTRSPVVPLAQTLAMLNLDMVGRLRDNRLLGLGVETAVEFRPLLDSLNRTAGFDLRASGDGYGASDHQSFYLAKRPVLHFFTDLHEDYHRASDDADKLNAEGMARIAGFTAALARTLANRAAPLTFVDRPPPAPVAGGGRGYGAWLGSIPDMSGGGPGVRISGVTPGSPAEAAGLKADDVLLQIGDHPVLDLQGMTEALRKHQPGDTVAVVVRRGARSDTVRVILGATRFMSTAPVLDATRIVAALRGAFTRDQPRQELLRMAAEKIQAAGPPYTSVYLYMLHGRELVLEALAGRDTEHTRIPVGKGVCGTAVSTGADQNVGDVRAIGNYIACNTFTRSELVVLIRRGATILGQIDVDSDVPDPFTPAEEAEVKRVADALAVLL